MDILSIVLLILIGIWFLLAVRYIYRTGKRGGCMGCGGSSDRRDGRSKKCDGRSDKCTDCGGGRCSGCGGSDTCKLCGQTENKTSQ